MDKKGNIKKVDDKKHVDKDGNEIDMIVSGKARYKDGKLKNKSKKAVKKGLLKGKVETKVNGVSAVIINVGDNEAEGKSLFEWLAASTDVEWSIFKTNSEVFGDKVTLSTSHSKDSESAGGSLASDKAVDLEYHIHSHPSKGPSEDFNRAKPSDADTGFRNNVKAKNSTVSFSVYLSGQYYPY